LRLDLSPYEFRKNQNVKRVSSETFKLTLRVSDQGKGVEAALKQSIEKSWKTGETRLWIEFQKTADWEILFAQVFGSRVNTESKKAFGGAQLEEHDLAYLTGRILGLPPARTLRWDSPHCTYSLVVNDSDLMSHPKSGAVTESHWEALKENYRQKK